MLRRIDRWPPVSPGAANAWLLLVTTKPPTWRDPLYPWVERPPALGSMHEGFLYPDPLGFWAEVRRWSVTCLRSRQPLWDASEALAITALVHVADTSDRLPYMLITCRPGAVLFLDEPAWRSSGWEGEAHVVRHHIPDPHRRGQVYQGHWGVLPDGLIVGKAPQHPSAHRFYRAADMDGFLGAMPRNPD